MPVTIQIRNVPEALHRRLKKRAAQAETSLSDYLLDEVRRAAEQPTLDGMLDRLAKLPPVASDISAAEAVREERDSR